MLQHTRRLWPHSLVRRGPALVLLAGLPVLASQIGCQQAANSPDGIQTVRVDEVSGYVEMVSKTREQKERSKTGGQDRDAKEQLFQENMRLDTAGSVYHPNLMEYTLGGLFGLLQHRFHQDPDPFGLNGSEDGTVVEYDFTGDFLKQKPYPGSVYARRRQGLEPREFAPSAETTTDSYGGIWQYLSDQTPTSLRFDYNDIRYHSLANIENETKRKNLDLRFETAYKLNDYNFFSLTAEHQSVDETTRTEDEPFKFSYDTDELILGHHWDFGGERQHKLESELEAYRQRGSFDTERLRWRERLRLKHTDSLRSWYDWQLMDQTRTALSDLPSLDERSARFSGTVEHRLYESLVSQLLGFGQRQRFSAGADIDRLGAEGRLDYRKKNPAGVLRSNYSLHLQREKSQGKETQAEVLDEPQTLRDPEPVTLGNLNIEPSTIVVTSANGTVFYQEGRDYRVRVVGDQTEIERIPTGRIADGETVAVDYVYDLGGTFELDTTRQNFGLRQDFTFGLSPYYRLLSQDQSLALETAAGAVPEDITAHIFGLEFRRGLLEAGAEYEDHYSSINSFDAIRLRAGYSYLMKNGGTAGVRATWTDVSFDEPRNQKTKFFTLEGSYRQPIQQWFTFEGTAKYRKGEDTLSGDQEGLNLTFSLEWLIRKVEIRVTGELKQFDDDFSRFDSSRLFVQVRRRF